jgi:hypothetical protein
MPLAPACAAMLPAPDPGFDCYKTPEGVGREALKWEGEDLFASLVASELTTEQAGQVRVGPIEYGCSVDYHAVARGTPIVDAVVWNRTYAAVPLVLGERRIADVAASLTTGGWQYGGSTTCENPELDASRRKALLKVEAALGGPPSSVRSVDVEGSEWLLAGRGERESAVLIAYLGYGCLVGGSNPPDLGTPGRVLSGPEYRALMGGLHAYTASLGWPLIAMGVAAVGALVLVAGLVVRWALKRRRTGVRAAEKAPV